MAYGIEILSSNNTFQLGTEVQESLSVINSGTCSSGNSVTYDGSNEILCFNRSTTGWIIGNTNSTATSWANISGATINWIKLKRITTDTEDDTGAYGIRIFNSGGTKTYSSNFTKGQEILDVKSPGNVSSTGLAITQAATIYSSNPTGVYVGVGRMIYAASTSQYDAYENLYFDYTNNIIRSRNLVGFDIGNGFSYLGRPNKSSLIVFKRKG
jgi:hypothetical protein